MSFRMAVDTWWQSVTHKVLLNSFNDFNGEVSMQNNIYLYFYSLSLPSIEKLGTLTKIVVFLPVIPMEGLEFCQSQRPTKQTIKYYIYLFKHFIFVLLNHTVYKTDDHQDWEICYLKCNNVTLTFNGYITFFWVLYFSSWI